MKINFNLANNSIVCGDNLEWLKYLPDECIDLCYIDPPFFSNRNYQSILKNGETCFFKDTFSGGISHYIEWMRPRIELIHKKLKSTGTIFLHCDWHASHRLRCLLDDVFKAENFVNEIIWCYKSGGASKKHFSKKHDTIFFYSKSNNYYFEPTKEKSYMQKGAGGNPNQKYYTDDVGTYTLVYMKDWWADIGMLATSSFERIGYPTQKPEKLIERIVLSCSKKNDIILDCFAGGGTTAVVCAKLGRNFIVGDVSPVAVKITAQRLSLLSYNFVVYDVNAPGASFCIYQPDGATINSLKCATSHV
jgi:DNA modification methylase